MKNYSLQTTNNQLGVLPFRVKSFKIGVQEFEQILKHLQCAGDTISRDTPLDWEERNFATAQIFDAIYALKTIRKSGEGTSN
jgi:hypothetical protein